MSRLFLYLIIFTVGQGCWIKTTTISSKTYPIDNNLNTNLYRIDQIDSVPEFYVIYASKGTVRIKILSNVTDELRGTNVKVGNRYDLDLFSILKDLAIAGKKIPNLPNNNCIWLSDSISVCIEPQNSIHNVYKAKNLQGLYFLDNNIKGLK